MIDAGYCETMAQYSSWMNEKLYALCEPVPDAERRRDRGAFFGSIHGTLNHLLYGDLSWMSRFTGDPSELPILGPELHTDFQELRGERERWDKRILEWSSVVRNDWLAAPMTFTSQTDGITRTLPTWVLVVHMFNHGTHHRGQVTTLLSQIGQDVGETDIHKVPGLAVVHGDARPR